MIKKKISIKKKNTCKLIRVNNMQKTFAAMNRRFIGSSFVRS